MEMQETTTVPNYFQEPTVPTHCTLRTKTVRLGSPPSSHSRTVGCTAEGITRQRDKRYWANLSIIEAFLGLAAHFRPTRKAPVLRSRAAGKTASGQDHSTWAQKSYQKSHSQNFIVSWSKLGSASIYLLTNPFEAEAASSRMTCTRNLQQIIKV